MSDLRFALVNSGHRVDDTEYDDIIRNFTRELGVEVENFAAMDGEFPDMADYDAGLVPGSSSSVYWDDGWIDAVEQWILDAVEAEFPILGVCFGHQILGEVLGGEVRQMEEYELGYQEIRQVGDDPILEGIPDPFLAFTSHLDEVSELPPGAELFAENDTCIHGFRYGSAYAIQFHPEYDLDMARRTIEGKDLSEEKMEAARASVTEDNYRVARKAKPILDNFVEFVRNHE